MRIVRRRQHPLTRLALAFAFGLAFIAAPLFEQWPIVILHASVTPPSFIQEAETVWNSSSTPKAGTSRTYTDADVLVGISATEAWGGAVDDVALSGGSGFSWTTQATKPASPNGSQSWARLWTAVVVGGQTFSPSFSHGVSTLWFGGNVLTFRGSDGVGTIASTDNGAAGSGAPSLSITTAADNSAIVVVVVDFNAVTTARTWRTVNGITPSSGGGDEVSYFADAAHYTIYGAYYSDAGTAGAKTVGLTAPSTQRYVMLAVEVKGAAGGGGPTCPKTLLTLGVGC